MKKQMEPKQTLLFLGKTNSGKTTLIKRISQSNDIKISESIMSDTTETKIYSFETNHQQSYDLVDTPGFNDSMNRDYQFLNNMLFVLQRFSDGLHQLFYLLPVTDLKLSGDIQEHFKLIFSLFGNYDEKTFTVLVTKADTEYKGYWEQGLNVKLEEMKKYFYSTYKKNIKIIICGVGNDHLLEKAMCELDKKVTLVTSFMKKMKELDEEIKERQQLIETIKKNIGNKDDQIKVLQSEIKVLQSENKIKDLEIEKMKTFAEEKDKMLKEATEQIDKLQKDLEKKSCIIL